VPQFLTRMKSQLAKAPEDLRGVRTLALGYVPITRIIAPYPITSDRRIYRQLSDKRSEMTPTHTDGRISCHFQKLSFRGAREVFASHDTHSTRLASRYIFGYVTRAIIVQIAGRECGQGSLFRSDRCNIFLHQPSCASHHTARRP
jgi:hypothetical protein